MQGQQWLEEAIKDEQAAGMREDRGVEPEAGAGCGGKREPACPPVPGSPAPVPSSFPPGGPWSQNSDQGIGDQTGSSTHLSMERWAEWRAESQVY